MSSVTAADIVVNDRLPADFLAPQTKSGRQFRELMRLEASELPMNRIEPRQVVLRPGGIGRSERQRLSLTLDGEWCLSRPGLAPIPCAVPGSIHTALMAAGVIPDPNVGTNAILARLQSTEYDWICEREFTWEGSEADERDELVFDGVCDRCVVSLNGKEIGSHQGMFGGPVFDVTDLLVKGRNVLTVKLLRALPYKQTVVFSNSYGWHYSQVVPLGIWRSVRVRRTFGAKLESPFIVTRRAAKGEMSLLVEASCARRASGAVGIEVEIAPKNFTGKSYSFNLSNFSNSSNLLSRFDFVLPEAKLWWPHGYGEQNLYWLRVRLVDENGRVLDAAESSFGVRELGYALAKGHEDYYPISLSVNGRKVFRNGTNWCTMDALMRFNREDYRRFLTRAKEQGVNWLRAWGLGLIETDEFYDLCDELGIMVRQEWPTGNENHHTQPAEVLRESAHYGTRRLRNRASLVSWCGGNETVIREDDYPVLFGVLGRESYLGDGTRLYIPQEENIGRAGYAICHCHIRWGGAYPEHYLDCYGSTPNSLGEWGADTLLGLESMIRTAGRDEAMKWPVDPDGPVAYRTAMFNNFNAIWHRQDGTGACLEGALHPVRKPPYKPAPMTDRYTGEKISDSDMNVAMNYARTFFKDAAITNYATLARGSQLAQAMCLAPMIGNLRSWGDAVPGYSYYKLNNCGPNGSWAVVDWYGVPTIAYWWVKSFMQPVIAAVRLPTFDFHVKPNRSWRIPVRVVDPFGRLPSGATARVRIFDGRLETVGDFRGGDAFDIEVDRAQIANGLRLVVAEVLVQGAVVSRTWLPCNYDKVRGSLFELPRTQLEVQKDGGGLLTVRNRGKAPAVGVELDCPAHSDILHLSDNWFWLEPGESRTIRVSFEDGYTYPIEVKALNAGASQCNYDSASAEQPGRPMRLFLLVGQSNMAGDGLCTSFVREYQKEHPGEKVGLIPCAVGGTGIARWVPGGDLFARAVERVRLAERSGQVVGILWHLGENDASSQEKTRAYETNLVAVIRGFRRELGSGVPFVAGGLGDYLDGLRDTNGNLRFPCYREVTAITKRVMEREPRCAFAPSDGLVETIGDNLHFSTACLREFGRRYYDAWRSVANENIGRYLSRDYALKVGGRPVEVIATPRNEYWKKPGGKVVVSTDPAYSYAPFTLAGEAEVEVTSDALDLSKAVILPESKQVTPSVAEKNRLVFRMRPGMQLVVEPTGRNRALALAANPVRADVPTASGKGLRYFGPGYHRPGFIELGDDERVYLADGAWVEGVIYARGKNISIEGPGVISGAPHAWRIGPPKFRTEPGVTRTGAVVTMCGENLTIRDVTIFSGWVYNLALNEVTNAVVDNVKVVSGRNVNDDGIDPCRTKNLVIRNSFVHTQDDCIAPKYWIDGLLVENCVLWNDSANSVRLGFECEEGKTGLPFRDIMVRNIDVIHTTRVNRGITNFWARAVLAVEAARGQVFENILFEDIRVHDCPEDWVFTDVRTRDIKAGGLDFCHGDEPGYVRNLTYRNIHLKKNGRGMLMGFTAQDAHHPIEGVKFENVTGYGPVVGLPPETKP